MVRAVFPGRRRVYAALLAAGLLLGGACLADASSSRAMGPRITSGESPAQILAAAQSALSSTHGYVMTGSMREGKQRLRLRLTNNGPSRLEMQLSEGNGTAAVIAVPGAAYIKANRAYWRANGGASLLSYANRWLQLPATYSSRFTKQLGEFNPRTLATCLAEDHGPLSRAGTTTVNGKRAVVLRDAGGVPGSNPGTLAVAATGPAYPLRLTSTGPTLKGGKVDACNDGKGTDAEGSLTISRFNDPPVIKAPANPLNLGTGTTSA